MLSILITYFSGLVIIVLKSIKYTQEGVSPFLFEKIFIILHIINIIILYKHKKIYKIKKYAINTDNILFWNLEIRNIEKQ